MTSGVRSTRTHTEEFRPGTDIPEYLWPWRRFWSSMIKSPIRMLIRIVLEGQAMRSRKHPMDASGLRSTARSRGPGHY